MRARRLFTECRSIPSHSALYIGQARRGRTEKARAAPPRGASTHLVAGFFLISFDVYVYLRTVLIYTNNMTAVYRSRSCTSQVFVQSLAFSG